MPSLNFFNNASFFFYVTVTIQTQTAYGKQGSPSIVRPHERTTRGAYGAAFCLTRLRRSPVSLLLSPPHHPTSGSGSLSWVPALRMVCSAAICERYSTCSEIGVSFLPVGAQHLRTSPFLEDRPGSSFPARPPASETPAAARHRSKPAILNHIEPGFPRPGIQTAGSWHLWGASRRSGSFVAARPSGLRSAQPFGPPEEILWNFFGLLLVVPVFIK